MNKVAAYLNGHLTGQVLTNDAVLTMCETDGGVLLRRPEMVARVAHTSDIRKIMRFCTQLAEKGHILPVTARGQGADVTGAAIGEGLVIDMGYRLHHVRGIDVSQQLIHVQAGMSHAAVNAVLSTHRGLAVPEISSEGGDGTIGGAIAGGAAASSPGARLPLFAESVQQLEVVLSNGEVLQTGRLTKREVAKKKGLSTLEGDIYRQIDALIEDNQELIDRLGAGGHDTAGYASIGRVRGRDGSIDLTPLFVGSQGTLGIISEVIIKAGFANPDVAVVTAAFAELADAQSALDAAAALGATQANMIDGRVLMRAAMEGKTAAWAPKEAYAGGVIVAVFAEFSERKRARVVKRFLREIAELRPVLAEQHEGEATRVGEYSDVVGFSRSPSQAHAVCPGALSGIWMPAERRDGFLKELRRIEAEIGVLLPVLIDGVHGFIELLPVLDMHKVSERRKFLQLLAEIARVVPDYDGSMSGRGGDGRLITAVTWPLLPDDERQLYAAVRRIFDPHGILNPGVKTEIDAKELSSELNGWCRLWA